MRHGLLAVDLATPSATFWPLCYHMIQVASVLAMDPFVVVVRAVAAGVSCCLWTVLTNALVRTVHSDHVSTNVQNMVLVCLLRLAGVTPGHSDHAPAGVVPSRPEALRFWHQ